MINLTTVTQRIFAVSDLSTGVPPSHIENKRYYSTGIKQKVSEKSSNLVLWGTNLSSTVGKRFTRSQLSSLSLPCSLNPYFITGLADAESSFMINIVLNNKYKTGWYITPYFSIELHNKDLLLLKEIQAFFWCRFNKPR